MEIIYNPLLYNPVALFMLASSFLQPPPSPSIEFPESSPKLSKRSWSKPEIQHLYETTKSHCSLSGKSFESLSFEDFLIISQLTSQPPLKCMKKIREICISGSLAPGAWSAEEDQMLINILNTKLKKWGVISDHLNAKIHSGVKIRSGKQCKERWVNHLDPQMKRDKWTTEEDLEILKLYKKLGNRWSKISKIIKNRTDSLIKNRIKSLLNKQKQDLALLSEPLSIIDRIIETLERSKQKQ